MFVSRVAAGVREVMFVSLVATGVRKVVGLRRRVARARYPARRHADVRGARGARVCVFVRSCVFDNVSACVALC